MPLGATEVVEIFLSDIRPGTVRADKSVLEGLGAGSEDVQAHVGMHA